MRRESEAGASPRPSHSELRQIDRLITRGKNQLGIRHGSLSTCPKGAMRARLARVGYGIESIMRLISVNVGRPQDLVWHGRAVRTSIVKAPVAGRVRVNALNLEGDEQSNLNDHGGKRKAVCVYPAEHYAFWRRELPDVDLPYGAFGENFTLEGWVETDARIGDRLIIGSAEFVVTQPRLPCFKLELKLGGEDLKRRVLQNKLTGYYLSVAREGEVGAGDLVTVTPAPPGSPTVSSLVPAPKPR